MNESFEEIYYLDFLIELSSKKYLNLYKLCICFFKYNLLQTDTSIIFVADFEYIFLYLQINKQININS